MNTGTAFCRVFSPLLLTIALTGCNSSTSSTSGTIDTSRNPGVTVITNSARVVTTPVEVEPVRLHQRAMLAPGKVFLMCNVTVTCVDPDKCDINSNEFRLTANNRQYNSYEAIPPIGNPPQIAAKLLKGGTITGDVIFAVDSDVTTGTVEYYRHWMDMFGAPK